MESSKSRKWVDDSDWLCDDCRDGDEYAPDILHGQPNPDAWPGCRGGWGFGGDGSPGWFDPCEMCGGTGDPITWRDNEITRLRAELAAAREALETIKSVASDLCVYDLACQALARHQQDGKADA